MYSYTEHLRKEKQIINTCDIMLSEKSQEKTKSAILSDFIHIKF